MGGVADAVKAGAEPISKFIDAVSRGIGSLYEPTKIKKLAAAKACEIVSIADAIRKNDDLPISYYRDGVQIDASDYKALAERANNRLMLQEMRKQQNIEAIVEKAYKEVETFNDVSSEPVDDDWIVRFFNSVEDVSNEKLQEIWARILAGEIKKPRSSSLRTLDLLKNLSSSEAAILEKVSPCILECKKTSLIPNMLDILGDYFITFDNIVILAEAGILNLASMSLQAKILDEPFMINNQQIVGTIERENSESPTEISIQSYRLTKAGEEIYNVIGIDIEKSREFALSFFKQLKEKHKDFKVSASDILESTDHYIRRSTKNLLI